MTRARRADATSAATTAILPSREGGKGWTSRYAAGKRLRQRVPRSAHATWVRPKGIPGPLQILAESNAGREPDLVPIRLARMATSPFAFLRGSAAVMASDLAHTPRAGPVVQLAGDAHLANFGVFGTPERDRVFDVNDFDETLPGPFEWDVKRLATSVIVAARQGGFSRQDGRRAAVRATRSYRRSMREFAKLTNLAVWYNHIDLGSLPDVVHSSGRRIARKELKQAGGRTDVYAFPRLTELVRGEYRIRDDPPLIEHVPSQLGHAEFRTLFARYRATLPIERRLLLERYEVVDHARKVVGIGSVGTSCWVVLLMGDSAGPDPLFLQLKEAQRSALEPHLGPSEYPDHAQRVVVGQHLIQEASDIFLGWGKWEDRAFYIRQLRDMKFSSDLAALGPRELAGQAELCAAALARAHARTGDPVEISGYLGDGDSFDRAIGAFAEAYADQNARDYRVLLASVGQRPPKARSRADGGGGAHTATAR